MLPNPSLTKRAAAGLLSLGLFAGCGDPAGGPDPQQIDHQTAQQAVETNTESAAEGVAEAMAFMRQTDLLGDAVAGLNQDDTAVVCSGSSSEPNTSGPGEQPDGSDDGCMPAEPEQTQAVEDDIRDGGQELVDMLNARIFVEANVENRQDTQITYLLDGSEVCRAADFEGVDERQRCIDDVDHMAIRLVVASYAAGDVDIDVLVGPDRYNPVDLKVHDDLISATVDLAEVRATLAYADQILDDDIPELPDTMRGRVRAQLDYNDHRVKASVAILDAVAISGADYDIQLDAADPAASITADSAADMAQAMVGLNAFDLRVPVTETQYSYNADTGEETSTETSYELQAHVDGASADATYDVGAEQMDIRGIGLGEATSTVDIDGQRAAEVDLNPDDGRQLDLTVRSTDDGIEVTTTPAFDVAVMLHFAGLQDRLDDLQDWMLDDQIRVTLDGADHPAVRLGDEALEVLSGQLHISSTSADIDQQVDAGQCLLDDSDAPTAASGSGSDGSTSTGSEPPASGELVDDNPHPFEGIEAAACP